MIKSTLIKICSCKSSNKSWICNKLFVEGDNKVRDHDHVTGKYRNYAHWKCNILNWLTNFL